MSYARLFTVNVGVKVFPPEGRMALYAFLDRDGGNLVYPMTVPVGSVRSSIWRDELFLESVFCQLVQRGVFIGVSPANEPVLLISSRQKGTSYSGEPYYKGLLMEMEVLRVMAAAGGDGGVWRLPWNLHDHQWIVPDGVWGVTCYLGGSDPHHPRPKGGDTLLEGGYWLPTGSLELIKVLPPDQVKVIWIGE